MKTHKPCKGTGKASGYGCEKEVPVAFYGRVNRKYGLGLSCGCYAKWLTTTEAGKEKIERSRIKAKKEVEKTQKAKHKAEKVKVTNWKNKLQTKVQEIARLIDHGQLCLARQIECKQAHGGHVFSKGGHAEMRFNLHNIHKQSAYSNTFKNDDGLMQEGIIREYGNEYLEFIKSLRSHPVPKLSNLEYHEAYKRACKIANSLKKAKRKRTPSQRISMRNQANKEIGIYQESQNNFTNFTASSKPNS